MHECAGVCLYTRVGSRVWRRLLDVLSPFIYFFDTGAVLLACKPQQFFCPFPSKPWGFGEQDNGHNHIFAWVLGSELKFS